MTSLYEVPLHEWFGLSRTNYFVMPRLFLQSQSVDWQKRFIALMDEVSDDAEKLPNWTVLRDGNEFTIAVSDDDEDPDSRIGTYYPMRPDPWADYRRGNYIDLIHKADK